MTTKEMERKALEQIRKIVEELGENSYVGMAFEGCFEDAEENIENDFGVSMKERWLAVEGEKEKLAAKGAEKDEQIKSLEKKIASLQRANEVKEDEVLSYGKEAAKMVATINDLKVSTTKYWNDLQEAKTKLDEKEDEIIRLKAKLFDLMVK